MLSVLTDGECAAELSTGGINTDTAVKIITTRRTDDKIFFIFILYIYLLLSYSRFPISFTSETTKVIIFIIRLPKSNTRNIMIAIARMVPSVVTKFLLIE